jgi:lipopolysaccharide export system permease protein
MCNIYQLQVKIDTIRGSIQERKNSLNDNLKAYFSFENPRYDTLKIASVVPINILPGNQGLDMIKKEKMFERQDIIELATAKARNVKSYTSSSAKDITYLRSDLNEFKVEYHRKFKLTFVCILFFFIGAPLGAIIRKGGLGLPIFFSIVIFIFFYAINIIGERIAEGANYQVFTGTWMSIYVMTPIAIFLTIKANNDSSIFNKESYVRRFNAMIHWFQKKKT